MMATTRTSPDFDPLDELRNEYFEAGRSSSADATERQRVKNRQRELIARQRSQRQAERSQAVRERQNERALTVREAEQARKAQNDAARVARQSGGAGPTARPRPTPLSSPNLAPSSASSSSVTGVGMSRQATSKLIIIITALGVIGTLAHGAAANATTKTSTTLNVTDPATGKPETVSVPAGLRSVAAVAIMGVVALIVNEIDPGIGLLLGLGIAFDIVNSDFLGKNGLFTRIQSGLFASPSATSGQSANTAPASSTNLGAGMVAGKLPATYTGPPVAYNPGVTAP